MLRHSRWNLCNRVCARRPARAVGVFGHERRIQGERGRRLLRKRGELLERPNAHLYDTGGMRRTHLRGHDTILKRLLLHASACNLGLWMRAACGVGTPRGLQGRVAALIAVLSIVSSRVSARLAAVLGRHADHVLGGPSAGRQSAIAVRG